jgi:hypothetical protein
MLLLNGYHPLKAHIVGTSLLFLLNLQIGSAASRQGIKHMIARTVIEG